MVSIVPCCKRIRALTAALVFSSLLAASSSFSLSKSNKIAHLCSVQPQQRQFASHRDARAAPSIVSSSISIPRLWSSVGGDDEATEKSVDSTTSGSSKDDTVTTRGVRKAILVVPLFMKFTIVLAIKLVTDLIVFPLLWTYRLARLTKRKLLGLVGIQVVTAKPNGTAVKKSDDNDASASSPANSTPSIPQ